MERAREGHGGIQVGYFVGSLASDSINRILSEALKKAASPNLRSVLAFCDSQQLNVPEAYIHFSPDMFGQDGEIKDEDTQAFLTQYMEEFQNSSSGSSPSGRITRRTPERQTMQEIRYLDKLIDELAKGRAMEKILRK